MPKTRFTREFQDEAVRLVLTSGRSQRAIADDLGVNRSTLARWMAEHQDMRPSSATPNEDIVDELKRLRRSGAPSSRREPRPRRRSVVTSTASTIPSGVIRHWTMSVRLSSKGGPDSYQTALHKSGARPLQSCNRTTTSAADTIRGCASVS